MLGDERLLYVINSKIESLWAFFNEVSSSSFFAIPLGDLQFPSQSKDTQVRWTGNTELPRSVKVSVNVIVKRKLYDRQTTCTWATMPLTQCMHGEAPVRHEPQRQLIRWYFSGCT